MVVDSVLQKLRRHSSNTSEWVASSVKKINKLDVIRSQTRTAAADSYGDRLLCNESLQKKFDQLMSGDGACDFSIDFDAIDKKLKSEHDSLAKREELLSRGFFGRKIYALSMFIGGDYDHFNGMRSFLRDFLR